MLLRTISALAALSTTALASPRSLLQTRDDVHVPTYLNVFSYNVTAGSQPNTYVESYEVIFLQAGKYFTKCIIDSNPSIPGQPVPDHLAFACRDLDGPINKTIAFLNKPQPLRPTVDKKQPAGTNRNIEMRIVPQHPEAYVLARADIFGDDKWECTNKGVPPFSCTLRLQGYNDVHNGRTPMIRLKEYRDDTDYP